MPAACASGAPLERASDHIMDMFAMQLSQAYLGALFQLVKFPLHPSFPLAQISEFRFLSSDELSHLPRLEMG